MFILRTFPFPAFRALIDTKENKLIPQVNQGKIK